MKMLLVNLIFTLLICVELRGYVRAASYDQSQSGDLNVQVDLKDLQIITLLKGGKEEYVDYDYAYDYSEMTIKPQNGTTPRPLNGTSSTTVSSVGATNGTASTEDHAAFTTAATPANTTALATNASDKIEATTPEFATTANVTDVPSPIISISSTNSTLTNSTNAAGCKKGFALNLKGDCELKLQGTGSTNALLKLVKLSQKLKLRRERRNSTISEG